MIGRMREYGKAKCSLSGHYACGYAACHAKLGSAERSVVELRGVEPLTSSMPWKRSSQLSYSPTRSVTQDKI
jgi:hypothetical protein